MSRPFNEEAYKAFDKKNKEILAQIMTKKGYVLVGDINKEYYKEYDLKFKLGDTELTFENETRVNFVRIRDEFSTIHIPIRKQNTQVDYYVVWKPELDEFFLIDKPTLDKYRTNTVSLLCNEYNKAAHYQDSFIDVPKNEAVLYRKVKGKWKKTAK
jgi:hypothetical protein